MSRNMRDECYTCQNRCDIPGDAHSRCLKPDLGMTGNEYGIKSGWFFIRLTLIQFGNQKIV